MQTTTSTTRPASGPASFNAGRGAYPKALLIRLAVEASLESRGIATDAGASSSEVPDGSGAFTIVLVQCDPAGGVALAPLLILTNAELVTT